MIRNARYYTVNFMAINHKHRPYLVSPAVSGYFFIMHWMDKFLHHSLHLAQGDTQGWLVVISIFFPPKFGR